MKQLAIPAALPSPVAALDRALGPGGASALDPAVPGALWRRALAGPAAEFLARPGKELRATIVRAGWVLGGGGGAALPERLPRGAVHDRRQADGRLRRDDAGDAVLPAVLDRRRRLVRLRRGRRSHARADPRASARGRRGLRAVRRLLARGVRDRLRAARAHAVPAVLGHGQGGAEAHQAARRSLGVRDRGGTGALVGALVKLLGELGGELRLDTPVRRIRVVRAHGTAHHLVTTDHHADEAFDLVVSNADLHHTYARLYGGERGARPMVKRLGKMDWSMSLFVLYFGTDRDYRDRIAHHTVVFGPRYRGLLDDIFHGHALPEDFSLCLHAPHITDPSLAPPGGGAFYVLSPVPHLGNAPVDWAAIGDAHGDRILLALERLLPDVRRHVVVRRHFTPADFESQLGSRLGSAFSVAPKLTQSAYFRPHNKDRRIPGLYIVGAGTHPGAGVPGVINGAKATCSSIARDLGLALADRRYRSGDRGVPALPWRAALAVHAARSVYAAIGGRIARADHDVTAGRAIVPRGRKLALVAAAAVRVAIACGVASCVLLVLAHDHRGLEIPAMVLTVMSFVYSLVDEVFHWRRYTSHHADPVEMWSHVAIFLGHGTMMLAWWRCYQLGYPGVREALAALGAG